MTTPGKPRISARKQPKQARSVRLVADILEAAAHVLARDGAHRFTTARVAERAGVSVGSLYQYFPSKEAILFRLQTEEWQQTGDVLRTILADRRLSPKDRLCQVVRTFFRTECEEAALRTALGHAAPLFADAAETTRQRTTGRRQLSVFMREALPDATPAARTLAADLLTTTIAAVGEKVSSEGRTLSEVDALAVGVGDMLCAYLDRLDRGAAN